LIFFQFRNEPVPHMPVTAGFFKYVVLVEKFSFCPRIMGEQVEGSAGPETLQIPIAKMAADRCAPWACSVTEKPPAGYR
jgi:hypothetical protein